MANKKFSEFTVKTSTSDVDFVVGYQGTTMKKIAPSNITGAFLPLAGGTLTATVTYGGTFDSITWTGVTS